MSGQTSSPLSSSYQAFEHKTVQILVRWLLLILAFHFVMLSGIEPEKLRIAARLSYAFVASNLLLMGAPARFFGGGWFSRALTIADFTFLGLMLYFIREPNTHYHWLFILLLAVLAWRRHARQILLALVAGLATFGAVARVTTGSWLFFSDAGDLLRAGILFAVALFYFFVLELLDRNAQLFHVVARAKQEWERTADAMSELILLVDRSGRIRRVNRAAAARLGKSPRGLAGQPWHIALDGLPEPRSDSPLARMFAAGAAIEARYTHTALGSEMYATAIPVLEDGAVVEAVYVLRA